MNEERRVVITGTGVVSCLGCDVSAFWSDLLAGKSGIGPITKYDASQFRSRIGGEVKGFDITKYMTPKDARRFDLFCHYAVGAADQAVKQAGLKTPGSFSPARAGVVVGSGVGGMATMELQAQILRERGPSRSSPLTVPMMIIDMAPGLLSMLHGFKGPNMAIVSACATGSHSIGEGYWMIRRGDADVMLAGGTEACIVPLGLTGFCAMKALSERNAEPTRASRPFDKDRDGFVPAEGAGVLVLELLDHAKARGAEILAEIVGYGLSGDAHHITAPDPEAEGPATAIRNALKMAHMAPEDIDYVNAHGTSTQLNDKTETLALKKALGPHAYKVPISSTKSMVGHGLGAAGGMESIVCVQSLRSGAVHATINYETPDPDCDLDYVPNTARELKIRTALNTNLGFGGHNAALIFRKWE
ncbi:MAG: beta-ketoacyl-[acyl-carrier-protein] synthase II [Lentisphaerae bacterium RIFOXYB12_FULL_65_16]|nr:MAG: beta-ketoacyl-[acyl-carrier-protein] synthase II [Lentisphaerae bacterium RIFOXYA12_64_32]OGV85393.1 MAG: beta-ketoacyl-[acyl-carrier-protein] synthase II [Lentisphaerae bacterium RIFOXYB12_FULL_65_16]